MAAPSTALPRSAPTLPGGNEPVKRRLARPPPCHSLTKQPAAEKNKKQAARTARGRALLAVVVYPRTRKKKKKKNYHQPEGAWGEIQNKYIITASERVEARWGWSQWGALRGWVRGEARRKNWGEKQPKKKKSAGVSR